MEPFTAKRLENVIERLQFKGSHCVIIIRSREHHIRIVLDRFEHLQASQAGHSYIEKHQIRTEFVDQTHGRITVRSFTLQFQPIFTCKEVFYRLASKRLIFDNNCTDWRSRLQSLPS